MVVLASFSLTGRTVVFKTTKDFHVKIKMVAKGKKERLEREPGLKNYGCCSKRACLRHRQVSAHFLHSRAQLEHIVLTVDLEVAVALLLFVCELN